MAFDIQKLYARTRSYRPDLDEAVHLYALTTSCRRVCQETLIFQITFEYQNATGIAGTSIKFDDLIQNMQATGNKPTYEGVAVTDVYYSPGDTSKEWRRVDEGNKVDFSYTFGATVAPQYGSIVPADAKNPDWSVEAPKVWMNDRNRLVIYPIPDKQYRLKIEMAVQPAVDDVDWVIDLPAQAEEPVVHGAIAELLRLPGENQNLQLSEKMWYEHAALMNNLTVIEMMGSSGVLEFRAMRPFAMKKNARGARMPWPR